MKQLVKFLPIAIFFLLCFYSCKKDTGSASYLRGKIDGVTFECNTNMLATPAGAGDKIISFRGDVAPYSFRFYLDGQGSNITTGSYDFQSGKIRNAVVYQNNDGYSAGYFCAFALPCTFEGSGKVNLLEISKKYVRGTFEFITSVNGATGTLKTITNGDFNMKRE